MSTLATKPFFFRSSHRNRIAARHRSIEWRAHRARLAWAVAAVLVVLAVFGPPLTAQSVETLVELRQNVLNTDREFASFSIERADAALPDDSDRARGKDNTSKCRGGFP
jgi:hypothetical protein